MSPTIRKVIAAALFGVGAAGPVVNAALADSIISGQEWRGILAAAGFAFWGKFSTNTRLFAAGREDWSKTGRREGK